MRFPFRNTTKDEALCCDILKTSFILVFDYKLVCNVNLSAIIQFSFSVTALTLVTKYSTSVYGLSATFAADLFYKP